MAVQREPVRTRPAAVKVLVRNLKGTHEQRYCAALGMLREVRGVM
jgi:hypothetical protein